MKTILARVRIGEEYWKQLKSIAVLRGRTVEELAGEAIKHYLQEVIEHEKSKS